MFEYQGSGQIRSSNGGHKSGQIQRKIATKILALSRLSASIWEATLRTARQVYTGVVQPALNFRVSTQYITSNPLTKAKGVVSNLPPTQNRRLRVAEGASKATSTRSLEKETFIPSIDIQLDSVVTGFQKSLEDFAKRALTPRTGSREGVVRER